VVTVNSTASTPFKIWGAVGIGNTKMINQDMVTLHVDTKVGDCWSTAAINTAVKLDNTTGSAGCVDNVQTISAGLKDNPAASAYYYAHFSRDSKTTDATCDTEITPNTTQLCYVWQDGDATLADFQRKHVGAACGLFIQMSGQALALGLALLAGVTLL
jgi:hypothetical protein